MYHALIPLYPLTGGEGAREKERENRTAGSVRHLFGGRPIIPLRSWVHSSWVHPLVLSPLRVREIRYLRLKPGQVFGCLFWSSILVRGLPVMEALAPK